MGALAMPWTTRLLTVAGAAQVRFVRVGLALLLPVELRCLNSIASTNCFSFYGEKQAWGLLSGNFAVSEFERWGMENSHEAQVIMAEMAGRHSGTERDFSDDCFSCQGDPCLREGNSCIWWKPLYPRAD
jgi:hypothetical protein